MTNANITTKKLFSLRDLIWSITLVLSLATIYFPMQAKVDKLEANQIEIRSELKANNLSLINYKLNEIDKKVETISNNFDSFTKSFYTYASQHP